MKALEEAARAVEARMMKEMEEGEARETEMAGKAKREYKEAKLREKARGGGDRALVLA